MSFPTPFQEKELLDTRHTAKGLHVLGFPEQKIWITGFGAIGLPAKFVSSRAFASDG